eukprot:NODE_24713_length_613_cov_6.783951.p3 GENE.NODE_24713_length_613_cov_6.783951~~NODE_24713_length_613_cov_6.783951.p3  ORF type:complete len:94 (+),score=28.76 NODE_24713_length_613_cov_6.783951:101-382(+)
MSLRGALQHSRRALMRIEPVEFTKSRAFRRYNLMEEDRIKWYNWNLACIFLTVLPITWMCTVNHQTCAEVATLYRTLAPSGQEPIKYDLRMYE